MSDLTSIVAMAECAACRETMLSDRWPSHYRTRAHREALARRRSVSEQADGFMSAVGRWGTVQGWPVHLQRQVDGKWVATIYRPDATGTALAVAAIRGTDGTLYWRGESYQGLDEALRNAAAAMAAHGRQEGRA